MLGRLEHGRCLLDVRALPPEADDALVAAVLATGTRRADDGDPIPCR